MSKIESYAKDKEGPKIEPRSKKYLIFLVAFMGLTALFDQYLNLVEGPLMPYLLADFGLTADRFALWQALYGIITFAVFFIGWLADYYGRKIGTLILILSMGIPALLIPLIGYNFHLFMFLYALVILGTLSNLWEVPIAEEAKPESRGLYGSITFLIGLFPIYALIAGPIAESIGWRWGYGVMGIFMFVLLAMWYKMDETKRWTAEHEKRNKKRIKIMEALRSLNKEDLKYIGMCSVIYGIWTICLKLTGTWGAYFYQTILGWSEPQFRSIFIVAGLLTMVGALLGGFLMDKGGRNLTMVVSCSGAVIGYFGLGITGSQIFFWLVYLFMPMVLGWIMIYFAEIFPTGVRSTAIGITTTAARASYVVGPLIASGLLLLFPTMEGFWIAAGIFMIIPIFSLLIRPYETKGQTLEDIEKSR
jgi:MFS family permease